MPRTSKWGLFVKKLFDFTQGYGFIEWTEEDGATFRAGIKTLSREAGGNRINVVLSWCARQQIDAGGGWYPTHARERLSFSKEKLSSASEQKEGLIRRLDFEAEGKSGSIYPQSVRWKPPELHPAASGVIS